MMGLTHHPDAEVTGGVVHKVEIKVPGMITQGTQILIDGEPVQNVVRAALSIEHEKIPRLDMEILPLRPITAEMPCAVVMVHIDRLERAEACLREIAEHFAPQVGIGSAVWAINKIRAAGLEDLLPKDGAR